MTATPLHPAAAAAARNLISAALTAWPAGCGRQTDRLIGGAILSLDDAAKAAEELAAGVHWSSVFPDMNLDEGEPEFEATRMAAQDLADAAAGVRAVYAGLKITLHDPHGQPGTKAA